MIHLLSVKGDELHLFLMSDVVSHETMTIATLDGYLSAVASRRATVANSGFPYRSEGVI